MLQTTPAKNHKMATMQAALFPKQNARGIQNKLARPCVKTHHRMIFDTSVIGTWNVSATLAKPVAIPDWKNWKKLALATTLSEMRGNQSHLARRAKTYSVPIRHENKEVEREESRPSDRCREVLLLLEYTLAGLSSLHFSKRRRTLGFTACIAIGRVWSRLLSLDCDMK
jgi:hypothetical protein